LLRGFSFLSAFIALPFSAEYQSSMDRGRAFSACFSVSGVRILLAADKIVMLCGFGKCVVYGT
jgi:hypothetical protein